MEIETSSGSASHVGLFRSVNEDRAVAKFPVFIVADGMGGHDRGDVASSIVADAFETLAEMDHIDMESVAAAVRVAHNTIRDAGKGSAVDREMGSTLVGAVIVKNGAEASWLIINMGDSRAYRYCCGELEQLSHDHSVVQDLIDNGVITKSDAKNHPERHVITRAIGASFDLVPDFLLRTPVVGERLLLCSDGVHDEIDDSKLRTLLASDERPQNVADAIVAEVLQKGAHDNLTIVVIDTIAVSESNVVAPNERTGQLPIASNT